MQKLLLSFKLITRIPGNVCCIKNLIASSSYTTREFFSSNISTNTKFLSSAPKSHHNIIYEAFSRSVVLNSHLKKRSINYINDVIVVSSRRNLSGNNLSVGSNQRYRVVVVRGSWFPSADGVFWGLIGANVVVFTMWKVADPSFMNKIFMISLDNFISGRTNRTAIRTTVLAELVFRRGNQRLRILLGTSCFLFPKSTIYFYLVIPVPAMLVGAFLVGKDLYIMKKEDGKISGEAHLGGATIAAIVWFRIRRRLRI
ncbi:hypothetical protein C5167_008213 [Papaver somniferum]|uniref:Peptidase S54 rhomboid domain-containing protein n=1 Tax=Papaver somniferum TaxID=3469 RepID=A0A4Y7JTW4_PAPSO|nr:hypothetical protein C5167_008213 [Papaver somniferum]